MQSRPLKVTAILNETSFGILKNELTAEITEKYSRDQIVELKRVRTWVLNGFVFQAIIATLNKATKNLLISFLILGLFIRARS